MKRKIIMSVALSLSLLTMLLPWFGGMKGVEEVYGVILLDNPVALTCILLAFVGIWTNFGYNSEIIGSIGMIGIIVMEIYEFMTWHILTISGQFDLNLSIALCYPEFYLALVCIVVTYIIYKYTNKKMNLTQ